MILTHVYSMCGVRGERQSLSGKPSVTFDRWLKRESGSTRTDAFTPADAIQIWSGRRRIWPLTVRIRADRSLECTQTLTVRALTTQPCKTLAPFPPFINLGLTSKCVCVCLWGHVWPFFNLPSELRVCWLDAVTVCEAMSWGAVSLWQICLDNRKRIRKAKEKNGGRKN